MTCFICNKKDDQLQQDDGYLTTLCQSLQLDISIFQDLLFETSSIKVCPKCRGNLEKAIEINEEIRVLHSYLNDVKKKIQADFVHSLQISAEESKNTIKIANEIKARLGQNAKTDQDIKILSNIDMDIDVKIESIIDNDDTHNNSNNSTTRQITPMEIRIQNYNKNDDDTDNFFDPLEFLDVKLKSSKDDNEYEDIPSPSPSKRLDPDYSDNHDSADHDSDSDSLQDFRSRLRIRKNDTKVTSAKDAKTKDTSSNVKNNQNQQKRSKTKVVKQNQTKKLAEIMSSTKEKQMRSKYRHRPSTTLITTCTICDITFAERRELLNHNSMFHTEIVVCNVCFKAFKAESTLKIHLRTHGIGETLFKCNLCPDEKFFSTKSRLKEHNESAHGEPRSIKCQLCSKGFSRKKDLDVHVASKHIGLRVVCSELGCDRDFSTPMAMKKHVRKEHIKDFEYFCPVESCDKGFVNLSSRDLHYNRIHLKIKPFKCSQCVKSFVSNCELKQHKIQNHTRKHKFPCSSCPKVFAIEKKLTRHALEVHSEGDWGFQCTKCTKKFANSSRLKDHYLNKHADHSERPIKCSLCDKRYVANSHLRVHERMVHKIKNKKKINVKK